jgi:NAD(P)-dependent dehydrogenase (short-subunit alcohol dehydrogenase family)
LGIQQKQELNNKHMTQEKVIFISGASSGIGAETAFLLSKNGYKLILSGRNEDKLKKVYKNLEGPGHCIKVLDAEDEPSVKETLKSLKKEGTELSGLICSAGAHLVKPLRITKKSDFESLFSSNFLSASNFLCNASKILSPDSSVVLLGSAGVIRANAAVSAYVSAKMALEGLTRSAALELSGSGIRVNAILPGVVQTDMTKEFLKSIGDKASQEVLDRHPLGIGMPEDIANLVKFLISDESRWITGQSLIIDGGFSIQG